MNGDPIRLGEFLNNAEGRELVRGILQRKAEAMARMKHAEVLVGVAVDEALTGLLKALDGVRTREDLSDEQIESLLRKLGRDALADDWLSYRSRALIPEVREVEASVGDINDL